MKKNKRILVLLASYNGEQFIDEQLKSLETQSGGFEITVLVSDDGSKDKTLEIVNQYAQIYNNIILIKNESHTHGAIFNFANLVGYAKTLQEYDYYMFSDQDDVWKDNKIYDSLCEVEKYNQAKPLLVYTSKEYVDKNLVPINFNLLGEDRHSLNLLVQNITFGCTYIFNKKLLDLLDYDIPKEFVNYDHYAVIQTLLHGEIHYLNKKTILYRQHGDNVSGTVKKNFLNKILFLKDYSSAIKTYLFLLDFAKQNSQDLDETSRKIIQSINDSRRNKISFICKNLKYNIRMNTKIANIKFFLALLFYKLN